MHKSISVFLLTTLVATSPLSTLAGPFTQIVAFGDSLTDTGNFEILNPSSFSNPSGAFYGYYDGRFSNGPNWLDQLASKLGVADPQPSLAGGTNYAYGAATADANFQTAGISVPYLSQQVHSYLQTSPAADTHALYVVWMGANDVFNDGLTNSSVPSIAASDVAAALTSLINAGGKHFLVPNLPGQGSTPRIEVDGPATVAAQCCRRRLQRRPVGRPEQFAGGPSWGDDHDVRHLLASQFSDSESGRLWVHEHHGRIDPTRSECHPEPVFILGQQPPDDRGRYISRKWRLRFASS